MENIFDFDDFINEEINFERYPDGKCLLTRPWYYYNQDDDIVYGSDVPPTGEYDILFENKDEGVRMISIDLNTGEQYNCVGKDEVIKRMGELFGEDIINLEETERIQNLFDSNNDSRYILLDGKQMLASSFDVIEEN